MGLESANFISGLNANNPVGATDPKSQGDDHIRLIKTTLLNTFPNITGIVNATQDDLNDLVSNVPRLDAANDFSNDSPLIGSHGTDTRVRRSNDTGALRLLGGVNATAGSGARVELFGTSHPIQPGNVTIVAGTGGDVDIIADAITANSSAVLTEATANHDALIGFVANEHINHANIDIIAGVGLTGGGPITANVTIDMPEPDVVSLGTVNFHNDVGHTHSLDPAGLVQTHTGTGGEITVSTGDPTGGSNGDLWLKV